MLTFNSLAVCTARHRSLVSRHGAHLRDPGGWVGRLTGLSRFLPLFAQADHLHTGANMGCHADLLQGRIRDIFSEASGGTRAFPASHVKINDRAVVGFREQVSIGQTVKVRVLSTSDGKVWKGVCRWQG